MSDAAWFGIALVAFFVLRGVAATVIFLLLLPEGERCPICDEPTLHVRSPGWNRVLPWFRTSWCPACQWEGLLRRTPKPSRRSATAPPPRQRRA